MAIPKIIGAQRDFSAGEVDVTMKRADDNPAMKAGTRQMSNWRILNSKAVSNRPGRSALFLEAGRIEQVLMAPGQLFYVVFGNGYLRVYNAAATLVFSSTVKGDGSSPIPWTTASVKNIVWDIYQFSIYICYADGAPNNVPQVLTWDGVSQNSAWSLTTYAPALFYGYQVRTIFYRLSPQNIAIWPSSNSGATTLTANAPVFAAGMVGTRLRFAFQEIVITGFTDSQHVTGTIANTLPQLTQISWTGGTGSPGVFASGQLVIGSISGAQGLVAATDASHIYVVSLTSSTFATNDTLVNNTGGSSSGALTLAAVGYNSISTPGITVWDDEVMNNYRGWPQSCFVDQGRLGFCNFISLPGLISWSASGLFTDQYTDPSNVTPSNAIQELAPGKSQVLYVKSGMEGSEFVFCDNAIYYIPITVNDPLKPGSVAFNKLSDRGAAQVQPRAAEQSLVYIKSGGVEIGAIQALGATNRPYLVDSISQYHSHLFTASPPIAIAIPAGSVQFEELYMYVLRADGAVIVGKYAMRNGMLEASTEGKPAVGWSPWTSAGSQNWVSALQTDVIFSSNYGPLGSGFVVEKLDNNQYLDAAVFVNNLPAALRPGAGRGPLFWVTGGSVTLIDLGTRMMGTYQLDAGGNIIPQNIAGENLLSSQLVAGQSWTAMLEPFCPDASPGQAVHQRMFKRRISRMAVYVSQSTGFLLARLFSGPLTRISPALGTIINTFRITAWNQDDDPTQPPPLREEAQRWRPIGRAYDPRVAVIKDTPGPLIVHEIGLEASI
jgi:hypothetical protein